MVSVLTAVGRSLYQTLVQMLVVVLLFVASFSVMGLMMPAQPLTHYKVSPEVQIEPPQVPTRRVILDSSFIKQERLEISPPFAAVDPHPRL